MTTMAKRKAVEETVAKPPGPDAMFRGKIRKPVTLTLTPGHHVLVNRAMRRLKLSRADVIALLIHKYSEAVTADNL
jgi:hypothetical protein